MSHNLYKIRSSIDLNEIGDSPQIIGVESPYSIRAPTSFLRLDVATIDVQQIILPRFVLSKDAKLTDFISLSYSGSFNLISNRFKKAISEFVNVNIDIYPVGVIDQNNIIHPYNLITSRDKKIENVIDWLASEFVWWDMYADQIKATINDIRSYDGWKRYWLRRNCVVPNEWRIQFTKLVLNSVDFDFAKLESPLLGFFVSAKLKSFLENENITGLAFHSLENYELQQSES